MYSSHPERTSNRCKHSIHPLSSPHTPWCPQYITSVAQANLVGARKKLEAGGGTDPPTYMRDRAWNMARLQYIVTKQRVEMTMRKDWLHQERERACEEARQQHLAQYSILLPDQSYLSTCAVCVALKKLGQPYAKSVVPFTIAWWERLVADQVLVPRAPPRPMTSKQRLPQLEARRPSHLRDFIQSYRSMRTVSDAHWRTWEGRCKIDRAVRRKYDLPDDFDIDPEFFAHPILASHAGYHHRKVQDGQHAGERRANRHKRRAEDYRLPRSSLALSNLAEDVTIGEADLEKSRLAEEAAELRRLTDVVATEVAYLYFIGEDDLLVRWSDDVEQKDLSFIYRKVETGMGMGQLDEDRVETEEAESEELQSRMCVD